MKKYSVDQSIRSLRIDEDDGDIEEEDEEDDDDHDQHGVNTVRCNPLLPPPF
jgi:hypothetical protein